MYFVFIISYLPGGEKYDERKGLLLADKSLLVNYVIL